jgi:hypothetical protein
MNKKKVFVAFFGFIGSLLMVSAFFLFLTQTEAGSGYRLSGWAWSDNIGWISFNSIDCDADEDGFSDGIPVGCPGILIPSAGGLVGHWAFDTGAGGSTAQDSAGSNTGTLTNMDPSTDWIDGQVGGALDFDGINDFVLISDSASLSFSAGSDFTFTAWARIRDCQVSGSKVVQKKQSGNEAIVIQCYDVDGLARFNVRDSNKVSVGSKGTTNIEDNAWHHLAGVKEGNNLTIYVDGIPEGSASGSFTGNWNDGDIRIGHSVDGGARLVDGQIDDVRIYNQALSPAEIEEIYDFGLGAVVFPDYGVDVDLASGELSGYAWADSIGWISFNRADTFTPPEAPFNGSETFIARFDSGTNEIEGWMRALSHGAGWDGWIKLRDADEFSYGVDTTTGIAKELTGWAWGGEVVGWISFNCSNEHETENMCATSDYKVILDTNIPPNAINLTKGGINYCTVPAPFITLSWDFDDPGDTQSAYRVQVDNNPLFGSVDIDSGKLLTASEQYAPVGLGYGITYYWRVKVWDSFDVESVWVEAGIPGSFATAPHAWPNPSGFSWTPIFPNENQLVQFDDGDPFDAAAIPTNGLCGSPWCWDFGDGSFSDIQDPTHSYSPVQSYNVRLEVCDELGCCPAIKTLNVFPLPKWKEASPLNQPI